METKKAKTSELELELIKTINVAGYDKSSITAKQVSDTVISVTAPANKELGLSEIDTYLVTKGIKLKEVIVKNKNGLLCFYVPKKSYKEYVIG